MIRTKYRYYNLLSPWRSDNVYSNCWIFIDIERFVVYSRKIGETICFDI